MPQLPIILEDRLVAANSYTITVNTTTNEDLGLTYVVGLYNAEQLAANPDFVPLTNQQYLRRMVNNVLADYKRQYREKLRAEAADAVAFN